MGAAVDDVNQLVRGRLAVGMVTACTVSPLFDALAACRRAHPGIAVDVPEDNSDRLVDSVRTGTLDLALVGVAERPPTDLASQIVVSERLVAAVPPGHPLAARRATQLAEVVRYPLICLPSGTGIRTAFERNCAARSVAVAVAMQASAPDAVADLAGRELGVAVLSESMTASYPHLEGVPIEDADIHAVLTLVWKPTPSPALRELLGHARRTFSAP